SHQPPNTNQWGPRRALLIPEDRALRTSFEPQPRADPVGGSIVRQPERAHATANSSRTNPPDLHATEHRSITRGYSIRQFWVVAQFGSAGPPTRSALASGSRIPHSIIP